MVTRDAAIKRLERLFERTVNNKMSVSEAYASGERTLSPENEEKNKVWLRNRLTDLVSYNFIKKNTKDRLVLSIQLTEEGKKALGRNEETKSKDLPLALSEVVSHTVTSVARKEKTSFNDILRLLSTFKKENPEYQITFDFNIKLKEE